jgi:hypothetical protein
VWNPSLSARCWTQTRAASSACLDANAESKLGPPNLLKAASVGGLVHWVSRSNLAHDGAAADPVHDRPAIFSATRVSPVVISSGSAAGLFRAATSSAADGNPHRSPVQAVTMMKIPSANNVVSTMTPMISSPHGNRSRAIATNAYMGDQRFARWTGIAFRQCQAELFRY